MDNHSFFDYRDMNDSPSGLQATEELLKWKEQREQYEKPNIFKRFWIGTKTVMNDYVEAKRELNRETVKSSPTLQSISGFIAKSTDSIQSRIGRYTFMRKTMKEMNKNLASDYVTI